MDNNDKKIFACLDEILEKYQGKKTVYQDEVIKIAEKYSLDKKSLPELMDKLDQIGIIVPIETPTTYFKDAHRVVENNIIDKINKYLNEIKENSPGSGDISLEIEFYESEKDDVNDIIELVNVPLYIEYEVDGDDFSVGQYGGNPSIVSIEFEEKVVFKNKTYSRGTKFDENLFKKLIQNILYDDIDVDTKNSDKKWEKFKEWIENEIKDSWE